MKYTKLFALGFAICFMCAPAIAQDKPKPEHYSAVAYLPRATARSASWVDIRISGYSSDEETLELANILVNKGASALRDALEDKKKMGSINYSRRVGFYDFKLVRSRPTETGRRIVALSDRPIGFLEAFYSGRSRDYDIGILILDLKTNDKGKETGEGILIYGAKISIKDNNLIKIENYAIDPVRLGNVKKY